MRNQLFIYGSCVSRDIVRVTSGRFGVVHYVARQSWISAAGSSLPYPRNVELSNFSARSLRGDFASNLNYLLRKDGPRSDVIVMDLASDRHGVYPVDGGYVSNTGELKRSGVLKSLDHGELIEFGSREHRRLFRSAAGKIKRVLESRGLFGRVLVLYVPFAGVAREVGAEVPLARGLTAPEVNREYRYYYKVLESLGFTLTPEPPASMVVTTNEHKWGIAQDHYVDELYLWWAGRIDEFAAERAIPGGESSVVWSGADGPGDRPPG